MQADWIPAMATRTQFWFAVILLGVVSLGLCFNIATAVEGFFLYAALLGAGILFVRAVMARRRYL